MTSAIVRLADAALQAVLAEALVALLGGGSPS